MKNHFARLLGCTCVFSVIVLVGCSGSSKPAEKASGGPAEQPKAPSIPQDAKGQPKILQEAEVNAKLTDAVKLPGSGDFTVAGRKSFDGWFLKADKVIFESGATLVFSKQAQSSRRQFFIIAKEIVSKDMGAPGTITWERGDPAGAPAAPGQAATGTHFPGDDGGGGPGTGGARGPEGYAGNSAPALTIVVLRVPSSGPYIDFQGQQAGKGGQGQKGGDGGNGGKGHPATAQIYQCKNGAGNGGPGGPGGSGGPGGNGGTGGSGGTFTVISQADLLPSLTQKFRVVLSGGRGGDPGDGGPGGGGGAGGPKGAPSLPYCKDDGNNGSPGSAGQTGPRGDTGKNGMDGDFFVGAISEKQFDDYVWK